MANNFKRTGCTIVSMLLAQNLFFNVSAMKEPKPGSKWLNEGIGHSKIDPYNFSVVSKYFKNLKDFVNYATSKKLGCTILDILSLH